MELQNYNQDIISTSSSDIPPNYPNTNNPSFPQNKYSEAQFETQQQYNPPPTQQQYYQTQNSGYSSHPQNQSIMPILPENQYPPKNYAQQTTPVFQPPLGVDLNISQINHSRISQPSKNVFTLLRSKYKILKILAYILCGSFIAIFGFIEFILKYNNIVFFILFFIVGIFVISLGIIHFLLTDYKADIVLGDNTLTIVKYALCCKREVTNYQKNDLSRITFTYKRITRRVSRKTRNTYDTYKLIFIFKNDKKETILYDEGFCKTYTDQERQFLVNYINNYINNLIVL